jgi:Zn-dependent M28 family amino/carboxypeptidase
MNYTLGGRVFRNIIVDKPGQSSPEETIIMGAHYDTCFNPGADDNASGVAGVLELARLLKGEVLKRNVKFIAFTNEEPPFFLTDAMGSRVYAQAAKRDNEKIKAAVILEMIGYYSEGRNSQRYLTLLGPFYPHRGNFLAVIGNFPSRHLVAKMGKYFKQASSFPVESLIAPSCLSGVYFSDHWSFWKEGYPAVMITDTAFLRNPHYHHDSDLPETLDYEKMSLAVHGLKEAIVRMANE